jgi:isoamylase
LIAFSLNSNMEPNLYVAFNASDSDQTIEIPSPGKGKAWQWIVNTSNPSPNDYYEESQREKLLGNSYQMLSYSAIMLEAKD